MRPNRRIILIAIAALACIAAVMDFSAFCKRAANSQGQNGLSADAVIALTGGSGLRIAAGVKLIEQGAAEHLLISGVHPDVTMEEIANLAGGSAQVYECCVDLDYMAETTFQNADETARWAIGNEHKSLIIVTSNYHMPRSLIHLRRAMPGLTLHPYPVQTRIDPAHPLASFQTLKGLSAEWIKWRITKARFKTPTEADAS